VDAFNIEIIAIGNELCYGKVADSNSFWLADRVTQLGGTVTRITCTRDSEDQICTVLRESLSRKPDFLLITGGLGPTKDDKTIDAVSRVSKSGIVVDEATLELVSERRGIPKDELPPHYMRMSRTLSGATTFTNPAGASPSTIIKMGETTLVVMPGPPKEVQAIFERYICDLIGRESSHRSCSRRVVVDMVESEVTPLIEEVEKEFTDVYLKPLVSEFVPGHGLPVEILAFQENEGACSRLIETAIQSLDKAVKSKGRRMVVAD